MTTSLPHASSGNSVPPDPGSTPQPVASSSYQPASQPKRSHMTAVVRGVGQYVLSLVVASGFIFALLSLVPGNPAAVALGVHAKQEDIAALSQAMGFDQPWWQRYFSWISGVITGDFGTSLSSGTAIAPTLFDRLSVSLILAGLAMLVALVIAVPLGMWTARRQGHADSALIVALSQLGLAIPSFFAGMLAIALFSIRLGWLPTGGWVVPADDPAGFIQHLILPVGCLALIQTAVITRYVHNQTSEILHMDALRTARALGAGAWEVLWRHGLRNIAPALTTMVAVQFASLLIGAVLIETVFVLPGIGSYLVAAVNQRDLPVVQAVLLVLVVLALSINKLVDVAVRILDPRLKEQRR